MKLQDSTTTLTLRLFCDPMVRPYLSVLKEFAAYGTLECLRW